MQFSFKRWARTSVAIVGVLGIATAVQISQPSAFAQTLISGDITGRVTDSTGAVVPGATVTIKQAGTGVSKTATSNSDGTYRFSLVTPGSYTVTATAPGFETSSSAVSVTVGQIAQADLALTAGATTQTVRVTAGQPLLDTDNANISTTFDMKQIQNLPNPGNDLTFVAQTAPGSVMNTESGYGNFSSYGLPATSNTFTVNGAYENDPYLNVNNSGATNLLLGNNDISQVNVISNAYDTAYGGLGGAQVNELTRAGNNTFHGNAVYWWNGRVLNANDFFNKQAGVPRSFDNVNQWAASLGGPIIKNKTFFFFNTEGLRIVLPTSQQVRIPNKTFETVTLPADLAAAGNSSELPYYQQLFKLYNNAPGAQNAVPLVVNGATDPNVDIFRSTVTNFTHESLFTIRVDQNIGANDHAFVHFEDDQGLQATYTDPISPLFNADSPQPQYSGQLNETHTFSSNLVNQFIASELYYRAVFTNTNLAQSLTEIPVGLQFLDGEFNGLGGLNYVWPQGRKVSGYQFNDDLDYTIGNHAFKTGVAFRRDDVTDLSPSVLTVPLQYTGLQNFESGNTTVLIQQFPLRTTEPVALYTLGLYAEDQWKALPNLTVTYGIRLEHNSNPVCQLNCFSTLNGNFNDLASSSTLDTPYNKLISYQRHQAFPHLQTISIQPRVGFAWSPMGVDSKTVLRGGFGIFADVFPAGIADSFMNNAPENVQFVVGGGLLAPGQPTSTETTAVQSNQGFQTGFNQGGSFNTISAAVPTFGPPSFSTAASHINYPTYYEWNLEIQRQINRNTSVDINYVGNMGTQEPISNPGVNAYNNPDPTAANYTGLNFVGLNTTQPLPNFSTVTQISSGAHSNYNGVTTSVLHQSGPLTLQFNYTYSHALDEISNGGLFGFGGGAVLNPIDPYDLRLANYGNADYDTRQYVSGSYVLTIPYYGGPHVLTDLWQITGTAFHNSGFPFTVVDGATQGALSGQGYGGTVVADETAYGLKRCGGSAAQPNTPCKLANYFATATGFGSQHRNQVFGPGYTDTDISLLKGFKIPHWQEANLQFGVQAFNVLNHPNFAIPVHDVSNSQLGSILSMVNTPTSILGSFLGGDAGPRLLQVKAKFEF